MATRADNVGGKFTWLNFVQNMHDLFESPVTMDVIKSQVVSAYRALGESAFRLVTHFDARDLALRNVLLEYDDQRKPKPVFVDFESTTKRGVPADPGQVLEILSEFSKQLDGVQKTAFMRGVRAEYEKAADYNRRTK